MLQLSVRGREIGNLVEMRGRKPKPTEKKRLTGNPGRRPLNKNEPRISSPLPPCPAWLDGDASEFWEFLSIDMPWLASVDAGKFACLCVALADVKRNSELLRREGEDLKTDRGVISHPAVSRKNRAMLIVAKLGSDFGLDPASRARLTTPDTPDVDEAEREFFGGESLRLAT